MSQADQLYAAVSALNAAASEYASISNTEVGISTAIAGTVGELQSTWKGAASQGFMQAWNRAVRDAANSSEALASASTALSNLASAINSNVQPFENLATVNMDKPDALTRVQQQVEEATSAIQRAANVAVGALAAIEPRVGSCSAGTEPLPKGWNVTLKAPFYSSGKGIYTGPGWYQEIEGGDLVKLGWNGGPDDPPPTSTADCKTDPLNLQWFIGGIAIPTIISEVKPILSSGNKPRVLGNTAVNTATSALLGTAYNQLKKRWMTLCNVSNKSKAADATLTGLAGLLSGILAGKVADGLVPQTTPKPTPTPTPKLTTRAPTPPIH